MLRSKRLHLETRSFLNIHVHELRILKELLRDVKNSDFICTFKSNCSLLLHERLFHIIVNASIYDFGNIQPNVIGQITHPFPDYLDNIIPELHDNDPKTGHYLLMGSGR